MKIKIVKVLEQDTNGTPAKASKHGNHKAFIRCSEHENTIFTPYLPTYLESIPCHEFDSILEGKIYLELSDLVSRLNRDISIVQPSLYFTLHRQVVIDLLPLQKKVKLTHVVDFAIRLSREYSGDSKLIGNWYVEAKGKPTPTATIKWKVLEANLGLFGHKLYFVLGTPKKQIQTIPGHSILPTKIGLEMVESAIDNFLIAYNSINGRLG